MRPTDPTVSGTDPDEPVRGNPPFGDDAAAAPDGDEDEAGETPAAGVTVRVAARTRVPPAASGPVAVTG